MKRAIIMMAGVFYCLLCSSQIRFNNRYNIDYNDIGKGIQPVINDYFITSTTFDNDSNIVRVQTMIIDSTGNIINNFSFFQIYNLYYGSWNGGLCKINQSEFALAGTIIDTTGDYDASIYRFNEIGDTLWMRRYRDTTLTIGRSIKATSGFGLILIGQISQINSSTTDIIMRKTDSLGNIQWQQTFDQSNYDDALSVIQTKDNGYLIGGFFRATALTHDALVIKTDSAGNQQWRKIIGNQFSQSVWDVVETADSNYVITGSWETNSFPNISYKCWLMKLNKDSGVTVWQKFYDDTVTEKSFRSIIELDDGALICAGLNTFNSNQEPYYGTIFKFSANGDSLWERNYLPPNVVTGWGVLNDIIATSDGGFIAVGEAGGDGLTQDTWILKVDSEGCEVWSCLTTDILEQHIKEPALIIVYPNPASGNQIQLKWNEILKQETQLQIFNSTGAIIFEKPIPTGMLTEQLDINSYANGLYFVRATGKDVLLQTRFVIIRD